MDAVSAQAMTSYDLIIFDCDGVLVDSEAISCRCLVEALGRHGIDVDLGAVYERFLGRSISAVADRFRALGRVMPTEFPDELHGLVCESFAHSLQAMTDVESVLRSLDIA